MDAKRRKALKTKIDAFIFDLIRDNPDLSLNDILGLIRSQDPAAEAEESEQSKPRKKWDLRSDDAKAEFKEAVIEAFRHAGKAVPASQIRESIGCSQLQLASVLKTLVDEDVLIRAGKKRATTYQWRSPEGE